MCIRDRYTIVAIAGLGEEYIVPKDPSLDDVIVMKENNRSSRALMMGTSTVTIANKKNISVSVTPVSYTHLVASRKLSYDTDLGNVAFSGDYSFKHILSLLKISIKGEGDMAQAVIDKIRLEGNELMTQGHYSFETNRITISETPKETFQITPSHTMNNQDVSFYFILNGDENDGNINPKAVKNHSVNLTIEYIRNNKYYITRRRCV